MERADPVTLADVQAALEQMGVDATATKGSLQETEFKVR